MWIGYTEYIRKLLWHFGEELFEMENGKILSNITIWYSLDLDIWTWRLWYNTKNLMLILPKNIIFL